MKLFAVFGNPVLHSRSPQLWNQAFTQLGIDAHYVRINPISAEKAINAIREIPLSGCNVTTPFKEEMARYMDELDDSAQILQAVNTVKHEDGRLIGINTDHYGVVNSLKENGVDPVGKKAVVLGAGGAARAAVYGLLRANAREVVIINRTYLKAEIIAERLGCRAALFSEAANELADAAILVSCIPCSERIVKPAALHAGLAVLDANYAAPSALIADAQAIGCRTVSALNWLIHQAVPAFEFLLGINPARVMQNALGNLKKAAPPSVALIGFMGAGKTTVGRYLSEISGKEFVDTDALIEQIAGESVPDIFSKYGERRFRELEFAAFQTLDAASSNIISCGGGAVKNPDIRALLKERATVIWLWCSLKRSLARIQKETRPLLQGDDAEMNAKNLLTERIPIYAQAADLVIINEDIDYIDVANIIKHETAI